MLLVLLLCVLALVGVWMDYRSADDAASRHDQRLLRLPPALADSVVAPPSMNMARPVAAGPAGEDFFCARTPGSRVTALRDADGQLLLGMSGWMAWCPPPRSLNSTAWNMAA